MYTYIYIYIKYKHNYYKYISCLVTHFPQKCTNQDFMHMFTN